MGLGGWGGIQLKSDMSWISQLPVVLELTFEQTNIPVLYKELSTDSLISGDFVLVILTFSMRNTG